MFYLMLKKKQKAEIVIFVKYTWLRNRRLIVPNNFLPSLKRLSQMLKNKTTSQNWGKKSLKLSNDPISFSN